MLPAERERHILTIIDDQGAVTVRDLAERFNVTEVTIRRDLQRMETQDLLRRTHGGAVGLDGQLDTPLPQTDTLSDNASNALIISPVDNRAAHTLREKAIRNGVPFLAESSPQPGAVYLGPRNHEAGYALGQWTAQTLIERGVAHPVVLDITQRNLPNTVERSQGFIAGLRASLGEDVIVLSVDGRALYDPSYQVACDALKAEPRINVIFGINDDAVLAGIQAYRDLGYDTDTLLAVNIGGEGNTVLNELAGKGPLEACVALFPEIVGRLGIDATCYLWAGADLGDAVYTPYRLLTRDTLPDTYQHHRGEWSLTDSAITTLMDPIWHDRPPTQSEQHVSFVIHYRTHEWYQNVARAMSSRASELGIGFTAQDVNDDIAAEIRDLRRLIGKLAASYVNDGDTILMDAGSTTRYMAGFLTGHKNVTVITNSLDVLSRLSDRPNINVILTGGEYDAESNALVGRGSHLLLEEIRADKAFLVGGGLSSAFGLSSVNLREAEVRRHMIRSAKEAIVLADHTVIGLDANIKVCDLSRINTVITDAGIQAEHSLDLTQRGIDVLIAGQVSRKEESNKEVTRPNRLHINA